MRPNDADHCGPPSGAQWFFCAARQPGEHAAAHVSRPLARSLDTSRPPPPALAPVSRGRMRMRPELRAGTGGDQLAARRVARRSVLQGAAVLAGGLLVGCGTRTGPA